MRSTWRRPAIHDLGEIHRAFGATALLLMAQLLVGCEQGPSEAPAPAPAPPHRVAVVVDGSPPFFVPPGIVAGERPLETLVPARYGGLDGWATLETMGPDGAVARVRVADLRHAGEVPLLRRQPGEPISLVLARPGDPANARSLGAPETIRITTRPVERRVDLVLVVDGTERRVAPDTLAALQDMERKPGKGATALTTLLAAEAGLSPPLEVRVSAAAGERTIRVEDPGAPGGRWAIFHIRRGGLQLGRFVEGLRVERIDGVTRLSVSGSSVAGEPGADDSGASPRPGG